MIAGLELVASTLSLDVLRDQNGDSRLQVCSFFPCRPLAFFTLLIGLGTYQDIDAINLKYARDNVQRNRLDSRIQIIESSTSNALIPLETINIPES